MLKPTHDYILLEREAADEAKIIVPETVQETPESTIFIVKAVGPGYWENGVLIRPTTQPGDRVFVSSYGLVKLKYRDSGVILSRDRDVVLIVTDEEEGGEKV